MVDPPWHTRLIRALTRTSMPCPIGSEPSVARFATWSTLPTGKSAKRSSSRTVLTSCCRATFCALLAAKDHVNVFLYDGAIVPDPEGIITGGHNNTTARTVAIREGETVSALALQAMFKQIIANNRAGGWRTLKRES